MIKHIKTHFKLFLKTSKHTFKHQKHILIPFKQYLKQSHISKHTLKPLQSQSQNNLKA